MRIIISEFANRELEDAISFYEMEFSGLGLRFKESVKKALQRISEYPLAWSIEHDEIRKCLLLKFPYKLLYSIEDDHILILAIAHLHRKPDYWIESDE